LSRDEDIELNHMTESLNKMNRNKSPGFDGLTVEFYQKFWNILGPLLKEIVDEIKISRELSHSMKKGIISLIYKNKGDKKLLKNWRPITLLNVDYKIIFKTLATRLKLVLDNIISPEQTCSIPGRDISDTIASIRDIIDYSYEEDISAYIIKIDSEKAFDRVSHEYLFNLLPHFGFGKHFIEWIKILYTDVSSAIKCNGHISRFFHVQRSVRQGCGLSALLYVIAAEPLNLLIKQSTLKGIDIKGSNVTSLIYQYADDTTLTLADKESVSESFNQLDIYCQASGARVNVEKSEVLIVNGTSDSLSNLNLPFVVKDDFLVILGIALGNDKKTCENINWKKKMDKIENILRLWKQRHLTLRGKSIVIQSLLVSRIWYNMNVQPLPEWVERDLKKHCISFLWNNKPPQIKYNTIVGKESQGGLNIPDIRDRCYAFRLKWLKKYFDKTVNVTWKHTMNYFLSKYLNLGLTYEIFTLIYDKVSLNKIPLYYRELLEAWNNINIGKREMPSCLSDIYNQPLFSNPHITKDNKMLHFSTFIKCDITKVIDIINYSFPGFVDSETICEIIDSYFPNCDKQKVNKMYRNILCSLPTHWKDIISKTHHSFTDTSIPNIVLTDNQIIPVSDFSCKLCYDVLRLKRYQVPTSTPFIESFGLLSNDTFWKSIFNRYKNPEMINLDFKIAHNIVWTREKLHRIKMCDTNSCPICTT